MTIYATKAVMNEGTIIVFEGETEDGDTVRFGVDHRMAVPIMEHLRHEDHPAPCQVESWQLLGGAR